MLPADRLSDLLGALVDRAHDASPDALGSVAVDECRRVGIEVAIFLVDYDQGELVPLGPDTDPSGSEAGSISVDGSEAGRAFRDTEVVPCSASGGYWIPLLDGVERLGVLSWVQAPDRLGDGEFDLDAARQVSYLLAHLLASNSQYCDSLHLARLPKSRTPEAELVWSMLPPLTVTAPGVVIAGALAPSHQAAGDVFDYAIDGGVAQFAIADATGHDTQASLIAALAVSAYRNARRRELDLPATVDHVETAIGRIGPLTLVTGVFGRLDLQTGDLGYVTAGHPYPLLIRDGRVIAELDGGRRPLLGITAPTRAGHLALVPGDCLLLYTDGITEARDAERRQFGLARLVSIVERCATQRNSAPETLRLITAAVLDYQRGVFQDDATMVLVQWQPNRDQVLAVKGPGGAAADSGDDDASASRPPPPSEAI